jgi:hypothetical protein
MHALLLVSQQVWKPRPEVAKTILSCLSAPGHFATIETYTASGHNKVHACLVCLLTSCPAKPTKKPPLSYLTRSDAKLSNIPLGTGL